MAHINPNIISKVQSQVSEKSQEWQEEKSLENLFEGIRARVNESEMLEAFPDGKEDYLVCVSYLAEIGDDPQVEEISDDMQAKLKSGEAAWDELFALKHITESGESALLSEAPTYKRDSKDEDPEAKINLFRERLTYSTHGYYMGDRTVVDGSGNEVEQASLKEVIDEKLAAVLATLNTFFMYRQELSRMNDPEYQAENASEEADEETIRPS